MPYDNPLPLDRPERFAAKSEAIARHAHADMALYATVTVETGVAHVAELIGLGAVAFKISWFESSPTRFPRIPADLTLDLLEALAPTDLPLGLHNEDQEIVQARMIRAREAGVEGIEAHSTSRPEAAELAATAAFHALGLAAGAHTHAVHLTTGTGFALTHALGAIAPRATGELCVHYLWFDAGRDGSELGARMKVNPPIRRRRDRRPLAGDHGGRGRSGLVRSFELAHPEQADPLDLRRGRRACRGWKRSCRRSSRRPGGGGSTRPR